METPPASSTGSSESIDSFEEYEQQVDTFVRLVEEAEEIFSNYTATSSRRPRADNIDRGRQQAHERLMQDYFADNPTYGEEIFKRRFRMRRELFLRIVQDLCTQYSYFTQRIDAANKVGFSPLQKCASAIRQLAYGGPADALDDYLRMGEKTSRDCLQNFCRGIIALYGAKYLRKPTAIDVQKLYAAHEAKHGFPGMLGSIDCTHWSWASCPVAWQGQYMRGDHEHPTIMLEAVASQDLWFWHAYFGVAGSNNDINVLNQSPIFDHVYDGKAPECPFQVNGVTYKHGYYLADGIYPEWATFVKAFTHPSEAKRQYFKTAQESARKDVERAFGVLKKRWSILKQPARAWDRNKLRNIMYACVILHNMIREDKGNAICGGDDFNDIVANESQISEVQRARNVREVTSREIHNNLRADLVEHIWRTRPHNNDD